MKRSLCIGLCAAALWLPVPAAATHWSGTYPDCASTVPAAASADLDIGFVSITGNGGGQIAAIPLPYQPGVTPPSGGLEGDVVAALVNLDFPGVLGGGRTDLAPLMGVPATRSGAQRVTALLFTGHFTAVPRTYRCDSLQKVNTVITYTYFEITLDGLLTPTSAGSPLQESGLGYQVSVRPGDVEPV